jgi:acyl-coenzyme A synthetase/AMP-(fatty) acid ligase
MAPCQRVRAVRVVDALPVTATGKGTKTELRARLAEQLTAR